MRNILYIIVCLSASFTFLHAQSINELNQRRKKAEEEIAYINKLLQTNENKKKSGLELLNLTQQKIKQRRLVVADIDMQIKLTEDSLQQKDQHIKELESRLERLKQSHKTLIYQAYKLRNKNTWLMFVLSSDDVGIAYRRWQYFRHFSEHINSLAQYIKETGAQILTEIEILTIQKQELSDYLQEKQREVNNLQQEEKTSQQMIHTLSSQERQLRKQITTQRKEIEKINRQIERIIAEETKKQQQTGRPRPVDQILTANFENNRGNLPWPVHKGIVSSHFGRHAHPVFKGVELPPNNGIDITTDPGSIALSIFNGKVIRIFNVPGMQHCVMLQHGQYYTLYCKLGSLSVQVGDQVKTGQNMGTVATGEEQDTVLHFELWKGTEKQNPELWLAK